ncbi:Polyribonucleotide nucleotidyltransferase [Klebsiella pneumoniae]|nr:Polyribonucleotide nucleotidyltransferase [Klebsiella pneumoniae]
MGYINDQYVLNPTQEELKSSKLDLVVAGTEAAVLMVESEAELLSEDQMLGAVVFGHEQQQIVIQNINDLVKEAGKPRWDWQPEAVNEALNARVAALAESRLSDAYRITDKQERYAQVDVIKSPRWLLKMKPWTLTSWVKSCTPSRKTWFVAAYWPASRVSMAVKKI